MTWGGNTSVANVEFPSQVQCFLWYVCAGCTAVWMGELQYNLDVHSGKDISSYARKDRYNNLIIKKGRWKFWDVGRHQREW